MTKSETIESLEASELARAEVWKTHAADIAARAEALKSERAVLEAEFVTHAPRSAVGLQALAEAKRALLGQTGTASERIAARVAARQGPAQG